MRRTTRRLALHLVVVALALGALSGAHPQSSPAAAAPPAVSWDGETFSSPESLAVWLGRRGRTYADWAARHPRAAAELEGAVAGPSPPAPQVIPAARGGVSSIEIALVAAFAAAFVLLAFAAVPIWAPVYRPIHERRTELVFLAIVLLVGAATIELVRVFGNR